MDFVRIGDIHLSPPGQHAGENLTRSGTHRAFPRTVHKPAATAAGTRRSDAFTDQLFFIIH
jgi:hypothetical protein